MCVFVCVEGLGRLLARNKRREFNRFGPCGPNRTGRGVYQLLMPPPGALPHLLISPQTIKTLRNLTSPGATAAVPRYNKSAFGGRGDRAEPSSWPVVSGPLDVVFFEGWMSGFAPVPDSSSLAGIDPALPVVNEQLRGYRAAWDELVDSWLVIRIGDPQVRRRVGGGRLGWREVRVGASCWGARGDGERGLGERHTDTGHRWGTQGTAQIVKCPWLPFLAVLVPAVTSSHPCPHLLPPASTPPPHPCSGCSSGGCRRRSA